MFKAPEQYRLTNATNPMWNTEPGSGPNGVFVVPMTQTAPVKPSEVVFLNCIASSGMGWEHVSLVAIENNEQQTPTWEEMCLVKDLFWDAEDCVVQFHPPRSEYVNEHPNVLHLWRPSNTNIQTPPSILVGRKKKEE